MHTSLNLLSFIRGSGPKLEVELRCKRVPYILFESRVTFFPFTRSLLQEFDQEPILGIIPLCTLHFTWRTHLQIDKGSRDRRNGCKVVHACVVWKKFATRKFGRGARLTNWTGHVR